MKANSNKVKEIADLQNAAGKDIVVEKKLDELITLLSQSEFDSETIKELQHKFNSAIEKKQPETDVIDAFKIIDQKDNASREELLDDFSMLLLSNKVDSKLSSKYLRAENTNKYVLMLIGIVIIALGFAMIIMPAPPYFEMFTVFYFSRDDGVTLMDLISLAIVFSGIYLLTRALYKNPFRHKKHD